MFTLKYEPCNSPLLRPPQELRDIVYQYTLVEPRKWDKRHSKTCAFHNTDMPAETPYRISEPACSHFSNAGSPVPICNIHQCEDSCSRETCKQTCLRRSGLVLLRANKQIYREASPIFWHNLVLCFDVEILVAVINSLPSSAIDKIRKVSIMIPQTVDSEYIASYHKAFWERWPHRGLLETLNEMENLVDLELPAEYFETFSYQWTSFKSLRYLRCITSETITYKSDRKSIVLDVALTKRFDVPLCRHLRLPEFDFCATYCVTSASFFCLTAAEGVRLDNIAAASGIRWDDEIQKKLQCRQPSQNMQTPYMLPLRLHDHEEGEVKVWGLPINHTKTCARLRLAAILKDIGVVPRTHALVRHVEDSHDSIDFRRPVKPRQDERLPQAILELRDNARFFARQRRCKDKRRDTTCAAARRDKYERSSHVTFEYDA